MDVRIENGVLTLCGERKQESEIEEENAYRMESVYGTFGGASPFPRRSTPRSTGRRLLPLLDSHPNSIAAQDQRHETPGDATAIPAAIPGVRAGHDGRFADSRG
jgi:hypothetical protein